MYVEETQCRVCAALRWLGRLFYKCSAAEQKTRPPHGVELSTEGLLADLRVRVEVCGMISSCRSDTTPLLNNSTQDRMFDTMSVEIEQLLGKLTAINDKMAEYTNAPGTASLNAALMHTLQRHRDILQDYTHEFHKTKGNFLAIREREDLLGSVRKDIETYKSGSGVNNRRTELFLKEHEHLRNSDRLMDDTISIAMATKENMTSQRGMLKSIQSRVNTLANRFPTINNLIQRINLRKRRDSLILGTVIGVCTILLLLYAFH
ncbi:Golgi SNAP receptor complex member 1 isoform X2 [Thunnus albacares]|uniref:Golgi SNAP receptor complex member 1 isoform X2 n=1 Tax=Thunnus albacares TaxID=8236 RepID=UPI001CF717A4|nr:Golgi SNAP receptor complex member 1 isoform X2 [Thunnus albacares]